MASANFLVIGLTLMLAIPVMFYASGVAAQSAGDNRFFGTYLGLSLLVVIIVGSLLISTAFLVRALSPTIGNPIIAFFAIAAIQFTFISISSAYLKRKSLGSVAAQV